MSSYRYSQVPNDVSTDVGCRRDERDSSPCSHFTFAWVCHGMYNLHHDRPPDESDVDLAASQVNAREITESLHATWHSDVTDSVAHGNQPKLWKSMFKVVDSWDLWFCILIVTCARILQPVLFSTLLQEFIWNTKINILWVCVVASGLWLIVSLEALINIYYSHSARAISASIRTALTGLMFNKILKMKESELAMSLSSHLIDKMSRHLKLVESCPSLLPYLFIAPMEFVLYSILLCMLVDWVALTGIVYLFICALIRCGVGKVLLKLRRRTVFFTLRRLRLFDDVIQGIRYIKMNTWERLFTSFVSEARRKELGVLASKALMLAGICSVKHALPVISLFVSMATLLLTKHTLNPGIVFTTFIILNILKHSCMERLPGAVENLIQTLQTLSEIEAFLLVVPNEARYSVRYGSPTITQQRPITLIQAGCLEHTEYQDTHPPEYSESEEATTRGDAQFVSEGSSAPSRRPSLSLYDVSCDHTTMQQFTGLTNVTFFCSEGDMVAITGRSGAGKTALLESIAGELPLSRGEVCASGKIAYVTQKPWLFKGTMRDNILFGEPFDENKYVEVVDACTLTPDFDDLIHGDLSVVGAPDVALSAGQRARISLARALYSDAKVYLLDEPLADIGRHTAEHIFLQCIMGKLSRHTCIMVTKHNKYLEHLSRILLLVDGVIVRDCSYQSLVDSMEDLSWLKKEGDNDDDGGGAQESGRNVYDILEEEIRFQDLPVTSVTPRVYRQYLTAGAHCLVLLLLGVVLILLPEGILSTLVFWVAWMSRKSHVTQLQISFLYIAAGLSSTYVLVLFLRTIFVLQVGLRSSRKLHDRFLSVVLNAPVGIIDEKAPDLLRTFSKDLEILDENIPRAFDQLLYCSTSSLVAVLVIMFATPWTVLAVFPSILMLLYITRCCLPVLHELRELEASTLTSLNEHFAQACLGLANIRSYGKQDFIWNKLYRYQDQHNSAFLSRTGADQWIAVRFQAIVTLLSLVVIAIDIVVLDSASLALSLAFVRELVVGIALVPQSYTLLEKHMSCAAEVLKFLEIKPEPGYSTDRMPPEGWPESGNIQFENVSLKYDQESVAMLKNISFDIEAGMKIACVGRTGAGKSSLVAALFRMPEPKGRILIDGIPISELNLREARSAMFITTREPFLFSGSLRKNLDPQGRYFDRDLWDALAEVRMKTTIEDMPGQLDFMITNHGNIFEPYECQLLGLARALLQDKKIVVLDGIGLDSHFVIPRIIENMLKTKFQDRTVITLVHGNVGLDTILCQDMVAVLDCGRLTEYDNPQAMLRREGSYLVNLWNYYRSAPPLERKVRFGRTSVSN